VPDQAAPLSRMMRAGHGLLDGGIDDSPPIS
jgi:hypothetical protein